MLLPASWLLIITDKIFLQIRDWLSPPEFARACEDALRSREDDTAEWLLDEKEFTDWKLCGSAYSKQNAFDQDCLWVKGRTCDR